MKKYLIIFLLFSIILPAMAADSSDDWNSLYNMDRDINTYNPPVTDKEFQEALDFKKNGNKKKKSNPYENIKANEMSSLIQLNTTYPTIMITREFLDYRNKKIPVGYYKIIATKNKMGQYFLNFFQGKTLIGKLEAFETENDYNQPELNYANIIEDNGIQKFIYGTIDYNLETILYFL